MGDNSAIEWCDATWNPIVGCSIISPGCTNCFAMKTAGRWRLKSDSIYSGLTIPTHGGPVWSGKLAFQQSVLTAPLKWKRPRKIFVNSMGDLFHEDAPDKWIDRVFAVMALAPQHTFQVLTKRSARMRKWASNPETPRRLAFAAVKVADVAADNGIFKARAAARAAGVESAGCPSIHWPLPNCWLGISAEDQRRADERVPDLLATPAAVRFVSAEPLLGPIKFWRVDEDAGAWRGCGVKVSGGVTPSTPDSPPEGYDDSQPWLDWIIVGGESGPGARPMHPGWARAIRDQCAAADVRFFFKQWGCWAPSSLGREIALASSEVRIWRGGEWSELMSTGRAADPDTMNRVGQDARRPPPRRRHPR